MTGPARSVIERAREAGRKAFPGGAVLGPATRSDIDAATDAALRELVSELYATTHEAYYSGNHCAVDGLGIDKVPDVVRVFGSLLEELKP